jgi:mediator of RNA polymerase II transcription subunit 9
MPSKMEGQIKAGNSAENGSGDASNQSPLNAQEVDVELLPLVHDIIRVLEKDCSDVSQRSRDSLEASQKIIELNKKVEKVREDIYRLPGIEVSKEEQMAQLQNQKRQLQMKKDLIAKYKELNLKVNGLSGLHQSN